MQQKPWKYQKLKNDQGKPKASKIFMKIFKNFSSSENEEQNTPEIIILGEEEQQKIYGLTRDSEDENQELAKVIKNDDKKNDKSHSRSSSQCILEAKDSENEECTTSVEDKTKTQTSEATPNYQWLFSDNEGKSLFSKV